MRAPCPVRSRSSSAASTSITAPLRPGGEIGDLHGRHGRRCVRERAGVSEVVEIVARVAARAVPAPYPVIEQRIVVGATRPRAVPTHRAEALEHDVGGREEVRAALSSRVPRSVSRPRSGRGTTRRRVAFGRLDLDDEGAEPKQLTARERAGQLAGEIDDRDTGERAMRADYAPRLADGDRRRELLDAAARVFAGRDSMGRGSATSPRRPASPTGCSTTISAPRKRCSRRSSATPGELSSPRPCESRQRARRSVTSSGASRASISARGSSTPTIRVLVREIARSPGGRASGR